MRGKYRVFTREEKHVVLEYAKNTNFKEAEIVWGVNLKSLKRWAKFGIYKKKMSGRKIRDMEMEVKLASWFRRQNYSKNNPPNKKRIVKKALEYSKLESFKASKGWLDKFLKRHYRF